MAPKAATRGNSVTVSHSSSVKSARLVIAVLPVSFVFRQVTPISTMGDSMRLALQHRTRDLIPTSSPVLRPPTSVRHPTLEHGPYGGVPIVWDAAKIDSDR